LTSAHDDVFASAHTLFLILFYLRHDDLRGVDFFFFSFCFVLPDYPSVLFCWIPIVIPRRLVLSFILIFLFLFSFYLYLVLSCSSVRCHLRVCGFCDASLVSAVVFFFWGGGGEGLLLAASYRLYIPSISELAEGVISGVISFSFFFMMLWLWLDGKRRIAI
jgi:hypothetical protein